MFICELNKENKRFIIPFLVCIKSLLHRGKRLMKQDPFHAALITEGVGQVAGKGAVLHNLSEKLYILPTQYTPSKNVNLEIHLFHVFERL